MMREFRNFALKGNVFELAVAFILGGVFGTVVKSAVADLLMPPLGLLLGDADFTDLFVVLREGSAAGPYQTLAAAREARAVVWSYGVFLTNLIAFVITAFALFIVVKAVNSSRRKQAAAEVPAAPTTKECPRCLSTIPLPATRCAHCAVDLPA